MKMYMCEQSDHEQRRSEEREGDEEGMFGKMRNHNVCMTLIPKSTMADYHVAPQCRPLLHEVRAPQHMGRVAAERVVDAVVQQLVRVAPATFLHLKTLAAATDVDAVLWEARQRRQRSARRCGRRGPGIK